MATTALAFAGAMAAGSASAADKLTLGVGGYMEQWVGYANRDDSVDGGFDVQTDAEVHFQGSLESDMGLKFTVHVELEAANDSVSAVDDEGEEVKTDETEIDEAFVRMSGEFGTLEIGQRDPIHARMHYAAGFGAGVGLNAGDTQNWVPGVYLETAGWLVPGDNRNVIYISPRVNGVQVGLSYGPDSKNENLAGGAPSNNDDAVWAAGINFNETIGDMAFKVSLGHVNVSNTGSASADDFADQATVATEDAVSKDSDDTTFTNAGISLGMGAFTFGASYATFDSGGYEGMDGTADTCYANGTTQTAIDDGTATSVTCDATLTGNSVQVVTMGTDASFAENEAGQWDVWAVGIGYTDGPMSVSIDHVSHERENGDERVATGLSAGYTLAPGVDWKSSIFTVEDDTKDAEGTVFVTGLDLAF